MSAVSLEFDDYDLPEFVRQADAFERDKYAFVVTPNVDHLIRYHDETAFRELYADAGYVLLDSRFLALILRLTHHLHAKVCAGSDLTASLFRSVIRPDDDVVLIGGSDEQANQLRAQHGLQRLHHFNPPMGFIRKPEALEECLTYIESRSPFRFCFLAVGSPQQEIVAKALKQRGKASGMALCIGASIDFLTGREQRAPRWMQRCGLEWLFRLLQNPRRLGKRYLVRGPRIFLLLTNFQINIRRK